MEFKLSKQIEAMNDVLAKVEATSGKQVLVQPWTDLQNQSRIRIAGDDDHAHILMFNPKSEQVLPYLAAFQCGFVLRMYASDTESRYTLNDNPEGRAEAIRITLEHFRSRQLQDSVKHQLASQLYDGILSQLRSVPVGLRVDNWIHQNYPELREQQKTSIELQLEENTGSLAAQSRGIAPDKIANANLAMNAAYALISGEMLSCTTYQFPYTITKYFSAGKQLQNIFHRISDTDSEDVNLVRAWGDAVEIGNWFELPQLP